MINFNAMIMPIQNFNICQFYIQCRPNKLIKKSTNSNCHRNGMIASFNEKKNKNRFQLNYN